MVKSLSRQVSSQSDQSCRVLSRWSDRVMSRHAASCQSQSDRGTSWRVKSRWSRRSKPYRVMSHQILSHHVGYAATCPIVSELGSTYPVTSSPISSRWSHPVVAISSWRCLSHRIASHWSHQVSLVPSRPVPPILSDRGSSCRATSRHIGLVVPGQIGSHLGRSCRVATNHDASRQVASRWSCRVMPYRNTSNRIESRKDWGGSCAPPQLLHCVALGPLPVLLLCFPCSTAGAATRR